MPLQEEFVCPSCDEMDGLEEVCTALQYSTISFYNGGVDYCGTETEGLEVVRYQCYHCGHEVCGGGVGDIYSYLKQRGLLRGEGHGIPSSDWEV